MRTPPHLPGRARHDSRDHDTARPRRHPYSLHEVPVQSAPRASSGTLDLPDAVPETDVYVEQRLLGIREMSNQAIGSIDDLLQHTA
ncbi:hypothetical protein [Nonomuraea basaltis]|uniref:hypothetical protein n=1 Tax=Nonomuraea basaltis TaxID=2495887 RepID=UPI00110C6EFF|nr:hypothetical protein [Nonomuraea basaltis]TMR93859.1 hypothetical protein EJK15_36960 [Nonomuraea basaltis]